LVVALARHVANVTTVDISAEQQHYARLEAVYAGVAQRIDFVLADARTLPWPAGSFDVVISMNAFHHLDDPERVFNEMVRVLKPGGKLVLADFSPNGFRIMDAIHAAEGKRHAHPPGRFAHWLGRLQQSGFAVNRFLGCHEEVLVGRHPLRRVSERGQPCPREGVLNNSRTRSALWSRPGSARRLRRCTTVQPRYAAPPPQVLPRASVSTTN
jgi:ubiquinone/menaquinone biosynthesis C-methylase UbiE